MYLATEVWPTSMPSWRSSPWILGAPQSGLARLISRISWRISSATLGLPARYRDFCLSIVVLPFATLSSDPAQDYLTDALTDELTTSLARTPNSFVIAGNTAFTFKGKPVDAKA